MRLTLLPRCVKGRDPWICESLRSRFPKCHYPSTRAQRLNARARSVLLEARKDQLFPAIAVVVVVGN